MLNIFYWLPAPSLMAAIIAQLTRARRERLRRLALVADDNGKLKCHYALPEFQTRFDPKTHNKYCIRYLYYWPKTKKMEISCVHLTFRREEIRIRKEEEKILEEILQDIKSLQKNNIPFTWTRCILETCLLGIYIHNLLFSPTRAQCVMRPTTHVCQEHLIFMQSTSGLQAVFMCSSREV